MNTTDHIHLIPSLADLPERPKRIVLHWTAGRHTPNDVDLSHYHYLVDGYGEIVKGDPDVADNMRRLKRGMDYAAHTRGFNSFSVGISFCGMRGSSPGRNFGDWPLTEEQVISGLRFVALCCLSWGLDPMESAHLFTHYEAEELHGVDQLPVGDGTWKWDITELEFLPDVLPRDMGSWIRKKVSELMDEIIPEVEPDVIELDLLPIPVEMGVEFWPTFFGPEDDPEIMDVPAP